MSPGQLIKTVRERHGLSQAQLALRAGTRQSAISRLERDEISPSVETLSDLLAVMGETLELSSGPVRRDASESDDLAVRHSGRWNRRDA